MPQLAYTVTATLPDKSTSSQYTQWLLSGHVDAVLAGGATQANVVEIKDPADPIRVQACYIFPSQNTFDDYTKNHAPALRADGLARFGTDRNISYNRTIGIIQEP